jgi:hypothetical protein
MAIENAVAGGRRIETARLAARWRRRAATIDDPEAPSAASRRPGSAGVSP